MTNIIDGKAYAAKLRAEVAVEIKASGLRPGLTVLLYSSAVARFARQNFPAHLIRLHCDLACVK